MNPVTGNDILNYKGDAALGLNDSGALPYYQETDLKEANNAFFNLAYLNMQKNKEVWQQKIKDRDAAMELIASDKLAINDALPEDKEQLMGLVQEVKDYYMQHNGDVKSDPKRWIELNEKLARFRGKSVNAKSRWVEYGKAMAEAAKETDPRKKQKMLEHIQAQRQRGIDQPFDPYQQTFDWDNAKVNRAMKVSTEELGLDETKPGYKKQRTITKIADSYRDYVNAYQFGDDKELGLNVDTFLENFFGQNGILQPEAVESKVAEVNARLKEIARQEGLNPDDEASLPAYLKPMKVVRDAQGQVQSAGMKWDDWFKTQLYANYQRSEGSVFDKEALDSWDKQQKNKIELIKARAQAAKDYAVARKEDEEARGKREEREATDDNFINDTQGAFRRARDSAQKRGVDGIVIPVKALSTQDRIGLGVGAKEKGSVVYDAKTGVFRINNRVVTPSDYYRNSLKEYYSQKIKSEDGVIDNNKLELKISQAIKKGLKARGLSNPEDINYTYGGMRQSKIQASDGKTYYRRGTRIYDAQGNDVTSNFE